MTPEFRQTLSLLGVVAIVAGALTAAVSTGAALRDARTEAARLADESESLRVRESRHATPRAVNPAAAPFFEARTVTQAGAALQQRVERAVAAASGHLISSRIELAPRADPHRLVLTAELALADTDMQKLLFDLETGRPYLFVDAFEARAEEDKGEAALRTLHLALTVSGQWSAAK